MATTDEELPEELDKLKITPNLTQVKSMDNNLPLALNPFFESEIKVTPTAEGVAGASSLNTFRTAASRRGKYRTRRASESVLDEIKNSSSINLDGEDILRTPPMGGVLKQILKKSAASYAGSSGQRKLILREPILKALQICLHPQSSGRLSLSSSATAGQGFALINQNTDTPLTTKGMSDFRDLIQECRSLLADDVDFSGRLNQLSLSNRNSKNFTIMQTQKNTQSSGSKLRNNRTYQKEQQILNIRATSEGLEGGRDFINCNHLNQTNPCTQPSLNLPRNCLSTSISADQAQTSARCSTSCSQQAGSTVAAATSDDVTIDELASYFDTFVHIPKKMSTMAEMMYI